MLYSILSGFLTGKVTRESAPEGSRVAWAENDRSFQLPIAPGIYTFADDERAWRTIDCLKAVAEETGM